MKLVFVTLIFSQILIAQALPAWTPVHTTPYDAQMRPVYPLLHLSPTRSTRVVTQEELAAIMRPIFRLPYRYTTTWLTPDQIRAARTADCKGKAILLLDELIRAGIGEAILVIGDRTPASRETHAWLEINLAGRDLILDPTYSPSPLARESLRPGHYRPHFAFNGPQRLAYIHPAWLVAAR